jgi:hypothetical protein
LFPESFKDKFLKFDVLVTYNGEHFDLPFLREKGWLIEYNMHVDLLPIMTVVTGKRNKKDFLCRDLGIYVPSDPCGCGWNVARLGRKVVDGCASLGERFAVAAHNANDLVATNELFDLAVREGWVSLSGSSQGVGGAVGAGNE